MLRLGGVGASWLPGAVPLALALAALSLLPRIVAGHSPQEWSTHLRTHGFAIGLGLVVGVAILVRLPGLTSDLGHAPIDIDENRLAANVGHFFATGELRHDTVEHYPGAVFWLFAFASLLGYLGRLTGGFVVGPTELPVELFVRSARLANVAVGGGIVLFTGLIGRRLGGDRVGLAAAALVAVVPLSVDTTILVRNDPGMVLAVLAAVYYAVVAVDDRRDRWVMASGALAGVATAIKYSSVFAIVPALIAAAAAPAMPARIRRGLRAVGLFVLVVGLTNHFVWADFPNFLKQLADQVAITGRGHWAATDNPAAFYLAILDRFGAGWPLLWLAAGFTLVALCAGRARDLAFLSFPLLYLWFMTKRPSQFPRWVFPLVPFVTVAGVAALSALLHLAWRAVGRWSPARIKLAGLAATVAVGEVIWLPASASAVALSRRLTTPTHTRVEHWVRDHTGPDAVVLIEQHWLDLRDSPAAVRRVPELSPLLDAGVAAFAGTNWVIVPEPNFGHPTLKRLGFVERFHADTGFGGSVGYDYEIYAVPLIPDAAAPAVSAR
ncbi:MAG: glycosyltransferase family 39 protein [Vicinamibacterales bacterium]